MTGLSPDTLINEFLQFFLEETRLLGHDLARLGVTEGLQVQAVGALRKTALAIREVLAVVTGASRPDPRRGEGRELARAHHAIFVAKLALDVLEAGAEKWLKSRV